MKELISEELEEVLIEQIAHEIYNSHLYLYIANFLNGKGLSNLAKLFMSQWSEEQSHSQIIFKLLNDLNVVFSMPEINSCSQAINSMTDISKLYLDREIETTESLREIVNLAESQNNGIVSERIREMVKSQQDELAEATDFFDKCEIIGSDWKTALLLDAQFGV